MTDHEHADAIARESGVGPKDVLELIEAARSSGYPQPYRFVAAALWAASCGIYPKLAIAAVCADIRDEKRTSP